MWGGSIRKGFPAVIVELKDLLIDCGLKDRKKDECNEGNDS